MTRNALAQLHEGGFAAVKADDLWEVANWCKGHWRDTGDVRYDVLAETFKDVWTWWHEHDESGGIPVELANQIEARLMSAVGEITRARHAQEGAALAIELRDDLAAMRATW
jgi:hypothetical protein